MATWKDFKDFFSAEEQDHVNHFIGAISSSLGAHNFSDTYELPEEDVANALQFSSSFINSFSSYIFGISQEIDTTGTDDEQWDAYRKAFSGDFQQAIVSIIEILRVKKSYSFASFKSNSSASEIASLVSEEENRRPFFTYLSSAFGNRIKQATDGYVVIESKLHGEKKLAIREFLGLFQKVEKYYQFESFVDADITELGKNINFYLKHYDTSRTLLNFLVKEFGDNLETAIELNKQEEISEEYFFDSFTESKGKAIRALYQTISDLGYVDRFSDLHTIPLNSWIANHPTPCDNSTVNGFQIHPNPEFKEGSKAWFTSEGKAFPPSYTLNNTLLLNNIQQVVNSSPVLEQGKQYLLEFNITTGDAGSTVPVEVYAGDTLVFSDTPNAGLRSVEFTSNEEGGFRVEWNSSSGLIRLGFIKLYEKLPVSCPPLRTAQEASEENEKIVELHPEGGLSGEKFLLYFSGSALLYTSTGNYSNDLTGLADAINNKASEDEIWEVLSASVEGNQILVTGPIDLDFHLFHVSLASLILDLGDNHDYFKYLAEDFKTQAHEAISEISTMVRVEGFLFHNTEENPIADVDVSITDMDARPFPINLGRFTTNGGGYFSFDYKLVYPSKGLRNFKLELFKGIKIGSDIFFQQVIESNELVKINSFFNVSTGSSSPALVNVASEAGFTIPEELLAFLSNKGIHNLEQVRHAGGIKYLEDLPVDKLHDAVRFLDAHASLYPFSQKIQVNQVLIEKGYSSPLAIGDATRPEIVSLLEENNIGSFNSASLYYKSKAYGTMLRNLVTSYLSDNASGIKGKLSNELEPVFSQSCGCDDCSSAVSPLAYLTDLINYALNNIKSGNEEIDILFLEETFFQSFTSLPHSCQSSEELICQQRVAVEILRKYLNSVDLSPETVATLNKKIKKYCFIVYEYLLKELGTSFEEIRDIRNASEAEQKSLARSLGFPYKENFNPFSSDCLFVDPSDTSDELSEARLEVLFGLQDTSRNKFSSGLKIGDEANQLQRWLLRGVSFLKNTDSNGFIYISILHSTSQVIFYKDASRSNESIVAIATAGSEESINIIPENNSGLSGELEVNSFDNNGLIEISLVPQVLCWRLLYQEEQWKKADWPANRYKVLEFPIIEPDIIGPDDFRNPDIESNIVFKLWENRRKWIDEGLEEFRGIRDNEFISERPHLLMIMDHMAVPYQYTDIDMSSHTFTVWDTVPDHNYLRNLNRKLTQGSKGQIEEAKEAIEDLHLSKEAFVRFFEIYNEWSRNDERGILINKSQTTGGNTVAQISVLKPSKGDLFELKINNNNDLTVAILATSSDDETVLSQLKAGVNEKQWPVDAVSIDDGKLKLEASESFVLTKKVLRVPSDSDFEEVYSIFVQARKRQVFETWIGEENNSEALSSGGGSGLMVNVNDFVEPVLEPAEGTWPIVKEEPLVDPEELSAKDLPELRTFSATSDLFRSRKEVLNDIKNEVGYIKHVEGVNAAFDFAWGEGFLQDYDSIEDIWFDIQDVSDNDKVQEALGFIKNNLFIDVDNFGFIIQLLEKKSAGSDISTDEWNTLAAILTSSYKRRTLYPQWLSEEEPFGYWKLLKAKLPLWRASKSDRNQWQRTLSDVSKPAIIDPDNIRPDFIRNILSGEKVINLYNERKTQISDLFNQIKNDINNEGLELAISKYVAINGINYLNTLNQKAQNRENISKELEQLNLSFDSFQFILTVWNLASDSSNIILDEEWDTLCSIMVQIHKERSYSMWLFEEEANDILLSPDLFRKSSYFRQEFLSDIEKRKLSVRRSDEFRRNWFDKLDSRIVAREKLSNFFKELPQKAEEVGMILLRDSLIESTITDDLNITEQADLLGKRLLIDLKNNCCAKVTRVSQAIEALHLLFFSIRANIIHQAYPNLDLKIGSDYFDKEWEWMGAYEKWRSAMFVNLYPENVLHPGFRQNASGAFLTLSDSLQNNNRLTPSNACQIVSKYYEYLNDVKNLTVVATISARTKGDNVAKCGSSPNNYKPLQFMFAHTVNRRKFYYSVLDPDNSANYSPAPWEPINALNDVFTTEILGAVSRTVGAERNMMFFVRGHKAQEEEKIYFAKFNLSDGYWYPEAEELDIPEEIQSNVKTERFAGPVIKMVLNRRSSSSSNVRIAIQRGEDFRIFQLNDSGNNLEKTEQYSHHFHYNIHRLQFLIEGKLCFTYSKLRISYEPQPPVQEGYILRYNTPFGSEAEIQINNYQYIQNVLWYSSNHSNLLERWVNLDRVINIRERFIARPDREVRRMEYGVINENGRIEVSDSPQILNREYLCYFEWRSPRGPVRYLFGNLGGRHELTYQKQTPIVSEPISFLSNVNFIDYFTDNKSNSFLLINTRSYNTFILPIYRDTLQGNLNNIAIHPAIPSVRINYGLVSPPEVFPVKKPDDLDELKFNVERSYKNNSYLPKSLFSVIEEAYYFVPLMVALTLQDKGYYLEALDWYRLVYAFDRPENTEEGDYKPRKIWYGLVHEEKNLQEFKRSENWLKDPLNPHSIAETRANSYTRFTVYSIAGCILEFADSEFTKDNAESIPKARMLYETALRLLDAEGLLPEDSNCAPIIEDLEPLLPKDDHNWPYWKPVWLEIKSDLLRVKNREKLLNLSALIQNVLSETESIDEKFSQIRNLVNSAFETPEQFTFILSLITSGRVQSEDALNRLLANADLQEGLKHFISEAGKYYLNAVINVTGIMPEALTSDTVAIPWLSQLPILEEQTPEPASITNITGTLPLSPYFVRERAYYYFTQPDAQQLQTLSVINNPVRVINDYYGRDVFYTPQLNPDFCVPPNPVLNSLRFSAEANLFKIRNCMNIAGINREVLPYAAPVDQVAGMPVLGGGGRLISTGTRVFTPSLYRFDVLIERAKQQVNIAQQIEGALLSIYEKEDAATYDVLRARQDLRMARSGVRLQELKMREAESNIVLAQLQTDRVRLSMNHFSNLISAGRSGSEENALRLLYTSATFHTISSTLYTIGANPMNIWALGAAAASVGQTMGVLSSISSMIASFERREEEWRYQLELSQQDLIIGEQQEIIAQQRYDIADQERVIAQMQADNAGEVLDFLSSKFTNAELYQWMSGILEKVYSFFLHQATATAKAAAMQLEFERQEQIPDFIKDDYWEAPSRNTLSGSGTGPDRRGLTGSYRLLQNVSELDQFALETDQRKLQLTKTISLTRMAPSEFQRFKETGQINFKTTLDMFDRDFPGHYLRLIKKVKTSVVALVPPTEGIKATLRNPGVSYAVNGTNFRKDVIVRPPDSISLSSAHEASGLFELEEQRTDKLYPFENIGVETNWELIMPKAANFFDYSTIADVFITIEYTALDSRIYRNEVIKRLGNSFSGDRIFSFKNAFPDQWYDFSNPETPGQSVTVSFKTLPRDFPENLINLRIKGLSIFTTLVNGEDSAPSGEIVLGFRSNDGDFISGGASFATVLTAGTTAPGWGAVIDNKPAVGEWQMSLSPEIIDKIVNEEITDIVMALTINATTPEWPSY
ncbi:hypothetical protein RCC89_19575 [Cytophagaceae bacterium ABcell3]|nr:hypothetical protein RCC89_19575 [Cytophagaceae bacterium ABcell3]